ncbi:MAG TPA: glycosyltransferase family 9 protein [Flavobacterium sp.]|nr:glycosyltransferase family 9 protein [Flavobacterium sp.]
MSYKIKHIAVIRLSAMGDVAMAAPILRAFTKQYPDVHVTMVSKPFFEPFFEGIPNVDFFAVDVAGKHKGFPGLLQLFSDLKKSGIDAVADLHNVLRSKIIRRIFAMNGKKTAHTDKARGEKKALTRETNKVFKPLKSVFERHAEVFEILGFPIDLTHPEFPEKQKLDEAVGHLAGEKTQKWIGIAPFAQHQGKVYPKDLMQTVIDQLAAISDYKIFLFGGGASETEILNEFAGHHKNVIVAAGKLDFNQELQLISNLDLMLSMDSGNSHIAAMYGIPVVTLWGATHPYTGFSPFNQPFENALVSDREQYPKLPTSVYGNIKIEGYDDAMRTILPETVMAKVKSVLK